MADLQDVHIGRLIEEVFRESGMTAKELAEQLHCERTNIYTIFRRSSVDVELLAKLSRALHHNFLDDAMRLYGLTATWSPTLNICLRFEDMTAEAIARMADCLEEFKRHA